MTLMGERNGRKFRWISWQAEAGHIARAEAMSKLRDEYHAEWEGITNLVHDPNVDYNAAYHERDSVLRDRHRPYYEFLKNEERAKLGLNPVRKSIRERRNGEL